MTRLLRRAATLWPEVRFDSPAAKLWSQALEGVSAAQASSALDRWMRTMPHPPKPSDVRSTLRALRAENGQPEPRPGGPVSRPTCPDCEHGWITCPPVIRTLPDGTVRRSAEVTRPCVRCAPDTHERWSAGAYTRGGRA